MSCKAVSPLNGKVLKGKRNPTQNIFPNGSDLKGITLSDRAILPEFEETKFGLVLIYSCDIASRRNNANIYCGLWIGWVENECQYFR